MRAGFMAHPACGHFLTGRAVAFCPRRCYSHRMIIVQRYAAALALGFCVLSAPQGAHAGEAQVVKAEVRAQGEQRYAFSVTLRHADEGWDHYADRWDVLSPDGTVLGSRVLAHPHVDEQPFTRSQSNILIPSTTPFVIIRAHDTVHGDSAKTVRFELP